jgi:hypothetical protein
LYHILFLYNTKKREKVPHYIRYINENIRMKKIKYFEEWSVSEGILDIFKKKKKEKNSNAIHLNGYIKIPKLGDKKDVKLESSNIYPSKNKDQIQFMIRNNGIDHIIFYTKNKNDKSIKVFSGGKSTSMELDNQEADRLRKKYLS